MNNENQNSNGNLGQNLEPNHNQSNIFDEPSQDATQTINEIKDVTSNVTTPETAVNVAETTASIDTGNANITQDLNANQETNSIEVNNTPLNNEPLETKLVKEDPVVIQDGNKKANKVIGVLVTLLIILIIALGLYFLMTKGIIPNPFEIKSKDVTLPTTTSTTTVTTTTAANTVYGNYIGSLSTCPNNQMTLSINEDKSFSIILLNKECTPTALTGTVTTTDNSNITFAATTNQTFTGNKVDKVLTIVYENSSYIFNLK